MKKIIITIIITISFYLPAKAQLQAVGNFRIADTNIEFGYSIPEGSTVYSIFTGQQYFIKSNIKYDKTLSQLTAGIDYVNYLPRTGGTLSGTLNSMSIIPTLGASWSLGSSTNYWDAIYTINMYTYGNDSIYGDVYVGSNLTVGEAATITRDAKASYFISTVATGTQPYATTSTTLNTNLNADLLDGQHGSYYLDYNNLNNKPVTTTNEYIGIYNPNIYDFNGVFPNGAAYYQASPTFYSFQHIILSDTTVHQGAITVSSDSLFINIAVDGDYEITYQFEFIPTLNESNMMFRLQTSSTNIFSIYEISVSANSHYQIIMNATIHLIAGDQIYLMYAALNTTQTVFFQRMRIFVKKIN